MAFHRILLQYLVAILGTGELKEAKSIFFSWPLVVLLLCPTAPVLPVLTNLVRRRAQGSRGPQRALGAAPPAGTTKSSVV